MKNQSVKGILEIVENWFKVNIRKKNGKDSKQNKKSLKVDMNSKSQHSAMISTTFKKVNIR